MKRVQLLVLLLMKQLLLLKIDLTTLLYPLGRYGVKRYPTLLLFYEGQVVTEYRGRRTLKDFQNFLRNFENIPTTTTEKRH